LDGFHMNEINAETVLKENNFMYTVKVWKTVWYYFTTQHRKKNVWVGSTASTCADSHLKDGGWICPDFYPKVIM
jgi:hypothetical protein